MTKVSVFKKELLQQKGKPIEFVYLLDTNIRDKSRVAPPYASPKMYQNVELISKGFTEDHYDVIAAWDDSSPDNIMMYFGHWNDGVV